MLTPASIAKHPIHPMLITIPIGLWVFSFVCDLVRYFGGSSPNWAIVALYTMVGGIVGALLAALPGLIDLISLPRGIRRIALIHMGINLTVVALYIVNAWWRTREGGVGTVLLSAVAIVLLVVSGWLGGKMVHVHGAGMQNPPETVH